MGAFDDIIQSAGSAGAAMAGNQLWGPRLFEWLQSMVPEQRTAPPPTPPGSFQQRYKQADAEMKTKGITSEQAATYRPLNDWIRKGINPVGYSVTPERYAGAPEQMADPGDFANSEKMKRRQDAWRLYLGIPQTNNSLSVSPYQPSTSQDPGAVYYRINGFWPRAAASLKKAIGLPYDVNWGPGVAQPPQAVPDDYSILNYVTSELPRAVDDASNVMGQYKLGRGQDARGPYFSYYDRWDLDKNNVEGQEGRFGKPFELYDRLYYDPAKKALQYDSPDASKLTK